MPGSAVLAHFSGEFAGAKLLTPCCRAYRKNKRERAALHGAGYRKTRHGDFSVGSDLKAGEEARHQSSRSSSHERLERCERSRYLTRLHPSQLTGMGQALQWGLPMAAVAAGTFFPVRKC